MKAKEMQSRTRTDDKKDSRPTEVEVIREPAERVDADDVVMRQAGASSVRADAVSIRQGGVVRMDATQVDMLQGGVVLARADELRLTASEAGLIYAAGPTVMDQSGAVGLVAGGAVTMDQSGAVLMAAPEVRADEANAVFLLARRVDGHVNAVFGPRESLLLGAAAGAAAGVVLLIARGLRGRQDR